MAENPLLPHRKLREMHALMLRCRTLLRGNIRSREAVFAATALHLQPGDLLCQTTRDAPKLFAELAPPSRGGVVSGGTAVIPAHESVLGSAVAITRGLHSDEADRQQAVALVFVESNQRCPGWQRALTWAQEQTLPLLIVITDHSAQGTRGRQTSADTPFWNTLSTHAKKLKLPVVTVDGEDAVALYRVMQETVIRARYHGGPAIIWAVLGVSGTGTTANPVTRLRRYMKVRNIKL